MVDKRAEVCNNNNVMNIPNELIQEADNLAKDTRTPFRECLDLLIKAYLLNKRPERELELSF